MAKTKKNSFNPAIQQLELFEEENFYSQEKREKEMLEKNDQIFDHTNLFNRLAQSEFRMQFHLHKKEIQYIREKGLDTIRKHAEDFVAKRLAPAYIPNDGKQTPMRGHPVFLAQHATACCCRGCFSKWHHIPSGRQLSEKEQQYAVSVLMTWIEKQLP